MKSAFGRVAAGDLRETDVPRRKDEIGQMGESFRVMVGKLKENRDLEKRMFEQDETRAREIAAEVIDDVRRLADANHHEAAFLMGTAYAEGLGVEANQELALAWYYRAANLGNFLAQHNLGNAYREGNGVPLDAGIAAYWYRLAADQGDALPCFWLGEMYERGEGLPQDLAQALRWYRTAASRGRDDAKAALERLGG